MVDKQYLTSLAAGAAMFICAGACLAAPDSPSGQASNDKDSTKNANIVEAQKLNGSPDETKQETSKPGDKKKDEQLGGPSSQSAEKQKSDAKRTASAVNKVPGVKVSETDLQSPTAAQIKGFHPIKKLLRPVENLEGMSIKLEQQIMKLEGPIAGLQPPMINLQKKMMKVDTAIGSMHNQLDGMQGQVVGVRSDLASMQKDIQALKTPIQHLEKPIAGVSKPLEALEVRLNMILVAILIAAGAVAVGTPIAAVMLYKNRHKLGVHDADLPKVAQAVPEPASSRRG